MNVGELLVIGAGPSGLAAAREATRYGASVMVLERLDRVGGLARTIPHKGSRFDIGPHRFFTKNEEVQSLFVEVSGQDLVRVPRLTRIYYRGKYFDYPLTPANALFGLGLANSVGVAGSYARSRLRRLTSDVEIRNFEDWIVDRFGHRLYRTFFKTYTEKVWGIPCTQIGADWAAQRIKGLSLTTAVVKAFFKSRSGTIKTLVDEFMYPRLGAGQLYEKMAGEIQRKGGAVVTDVAVHQVLRRGFRVEAVLAGMDGGARPERIEARHFLSSAPLTELLEMMVPPPPPDVLRACRALRYRHHIGVNLEVRGTPFPDNWIYVHSPEVRMARIANYRTFSPAMAAGADVSPLTVEYFASPGDGVWERSDEALIDLAVAELSRMDLTRPADIRDGFVVRSEKAYPIIEQGYERHIATIRGWLAAFENLLPIGRSGMFKYNNQDHAMATGLLAARTVLGLGRFDPWNVNIDAEYHEAAAVR